MCVYNMYILYKNIYNLISFKKSFKGAETWSNVREFKDSPKSLSLF